MRHDTFTLTRPDGQRIAGYRWLPESAPSAVVILAHGMSEHAGRYERFAAALTAEGYAVYAEDHRGHGRTVDLGGTPGVLASADGFDTVADDLVALTEHAQGERPGLPVVLFGHSMGSMLARRVVQRHGGLYSALVLSGTAGDPGRLGQVGQGLARLEGRLRGREHPSRLLDFLTFGAYNRGFGPKRTDFDWLSRDESEVDAYVADPLCGGQATSGFYADLIGGMRTINDDAHVARVPTTLPVLLISGDRDQVGDNGAGVTAVGRQLERVGVTDVTVKLYPQARHELLNETNRDEVTADILGWLRDQLRPAS